MMMRDAITPINVQVTSLILTQRIVRLSVSLHTPISKPLTTMKKEWFWADSDLTKYASMTTLMVKLAIKIN